MDHRTDDQTVRRNRHCPRDRSEREHETQLVCHCSALKVSASNLMKPSILATNVSRVRIEIPKRAQLAFHINALFCCYGSTNSEKQLSCPYFRREAPLNPLRARRQNDRLIGPYFDGPDLFVSRTLNTDIHPFGCAFS